MIGNNKNLDCLYISMMWISCPSTFFFCSFLYSIQHNSHSISLELEYVCAYTRQRMSQLTCRFERERGSARIESRVIDICSERRLIHK
jgi:hypothetical protein